MPVHANSIESYHAEKPALGGRRLAIFNCIKNHGPMTDRECLKKMGMSDMNQVRPRITELTQPPYEMLKEIRTQRDPVTKKRVRVVAVNNLEPLQPRLI